MLSLMTRFSVWHELVALTFHFNSSYRQLLLNKFGQLAKLQRNHWINFTRIQQHRPFDDADDRATFQFLISSYDLKVGREPSAVRNDRNHLSRVVRCALARNGPTFAAIATRPPIWKKCVEPQSQYSCTAVETVQTLTLKLSTVKWK